MKEVYGKEYTGPPNPSDIKDHDNNTLIKRFASDDDFEDENNSDQMLFPQGLPVEKIKCGSQRLSL